jgi:hypothetical protein
VAQLHTPARWMVACVTSPSACAAPALPPAGMMPSLAPVVLCGRCVAGARSGGGDGVDAVEAESPGRLSARCVTSRALRVHSVTWAGAGGLPSLPAVCAHATVARPACLPVCDLVGTAHAHREWVGRRRLKSLLAGVAQVSQPRHASLVVCDLQGRPCIQRVSTRRIQCLRSVGVSPEPRGFSRLPPV